MSEATISAETAIGISFMNSPIVPPIIIEGKKAKIVVMDATKTGSAISFVPTIAASFGFSPSSSFCCIFSATTMASSTTIPRATKTPISETIFMVYPKK